MSSIRTPPSPGTYTPGSTVTTAPAGKHVVEAAAEPRSLVDLEPHAVAEPVREVGAVASRSSITARAAASTSSARAPARDRVDPGLLRLAHDVVDLPQLRRRLPERDGARHVGVVPAEQRPEVELDHVPLFERAGTSARGAARRRSRRRPRSGRSERRRRRRGAAAAPTRAPPAARSCPTARNSRMSSNAWSVTAWARRSISSSSSSFTQRSARPPRRGARARTAPSPAARRSCWRTVTIRAPRTRASRCPGARTRPRAASRDPQVRHALEVGHLVPRSAPCSGRR